MNIPTDFYYPPNTNHENFEGIIILILQGVDIDKQEYKNLAQLLTEKGYGVMIPNFYQSGGYLCPDNNSILSFFQYINNIIPDFLNTKKIANNLIILGHSAGGAATLQSFPDLITPPLGIILYGCYPMTPSLNPSLFPPTLVIVGENDQVTKSETIKSNFSKFLATEKFFIELENYDHFTINNNSNPWHNKEEKVSIHKQIHGLNRSHQCDYLSQIIDEFIQGCLHKNWGWFNSINLAIIKEIIIKDKSLINISKIVS